MLSDRDIGLELKLRTIGITPYDPDRLQPCSYDATLAPELLLHDDSTGRLDPRQPMDDKFDRVVIPEHGWELPPGGAALGVCREEFSFSQAMAGRLEGKSSVGRFFLVVHVTAGFFDPGFVGYPTLELVNLTRVPIVLYPAMPIAQMSFFRLETDSSQGYGAGHHSKYQNQPAVPVASRYYRNFEDSDAQKPAESEADVLA